MSDPQIPWTKELATWIKRSQAKRVDLWTIQNSIEYLGKYIKRPMISVGLIPKATGWFCRNRERELSTTVDSLHHCGQEDVLLHQWFRPSNILFNHFAPKYFESIHLRKRFSKMWKISYVFKIQNWNDIMNLLLSSAGGNVLKSRRIPYLALWLIS